MSFCGLSFERSGRAVAWLLCLGCCGMLRAADPVPSGRQIEFSDVSDQSLVTNASPMSLEAAARPDLSDTLSKPFSLNSGKSSLEGYMAPPPSGRVVVRSRRAREQADLDRNWAFATPEDLMQNYMAQQLLNLPEAGASILGGNPDSLIERFYQRGAKHIQTEADDASPFNPFTLTSNPGNQMDGAPLQNPGALSRFSGAQSPFQQLMKNLTDGGQPGILDLVRQQQNYGLTRDAVRDQQTRAAQAHLDEFKQLFNVQSVAPSAVPGSQPTPSSSLSGLGVSESSLPSAFSPFSSLSQANPFETTRPTVNRALPQAPSAPVAPAAPSVSDTSSLTPASTYSPPAMTHVDFTAPRRKF